jgi:hypothetical protein
MASVSGCLRRGHFNAGAGYSVRGEDRVPLRKVIWRLVTSRSWNGTFHPRVGQDKSEVGKSGLSVVSSPWSVALLKKPAGLTQPLNIEHRTSNIEHRTLKAEG